MQFERMSASPSSSTARKRQQYRSSIRKNQIQETLSIRRQNLFNPINPANEVHRLKNLMAQYNVCYFQMEIAQVINCITMFLNVQEFCLELRSSYLIEDLIEAVLGELSRKSYIEAPQLAQKIVALVHELATRGQYFAYLVQNNFNYLVFALFRYPLNSTIVQAVTNLFAFAEQSFVGQFWKHRIISHRVVEEQNLIARLFEIYLLEHSYQLHQYNNQEYMERVRQGDSKWFKNASQILYISKTILMLSSESSEVVQNNIIKRSLHQAIYIFYRLLKGQHQYLDEQSSDCDCQSESTRQSSQYQKQKSDFGLFFINLVLDIYPLRSDLISAEQIDLMKHILEIFMQEINQDNNSGGTVAIKILKILYEQVIIDDEDLQRISKGCPGLGPSVESIIYDFI